MCEGTRVIRPIMFTPAQLVSTTANWADPLWVAGTYGLGARVTWSVWDDDLLQTLPHQFESVISGNTAVPGTDSSKWLDLGLANTYAMFGRINVSRRTEDVDELIVELQPSGWTNAIGFFGLKGRDLMVQVLHKIDGVYTVVQSFAKNLPVRQVTNMLEYLYEPFGQLDRVVFEGLNVFPGAESRIRIHIIGAEVAIGAVCYGSLATLADAPRYGASTGMTDYLGIERDDFGNLLKLFPEAPFSDNVKLTALVKKELIAKLNTTVKALRQTPTVWIGTGGVESYSTILIVYGVFEKFDVIVEYDSHSLLDLSLVSVATN